MYVWIGVFDGGRGEGIAYMSYNVKRFFISMKG